MVYAKMSSLDPGPAVSYALRTPLLRAVFGYQTNVLALAGMLDRPYRDGRYRRRLSELFLPDSEDRWY